MQSVLTIDREDARVLMEFLASKSEFYTHEMNRLHTRAMPNDPEPPTDPFKQFALWLKLHKRIEEERFRNATNMVHFLITFPEDFEIPTSRFEIASAAYKWVMRESENLRHLSVEMILRNYDEWCKAERALRFFISN